jgi:streptomycin 6-kinase
MNCRLNNQLPNEMPLEEKKRLMEERVEILSAELAQSRERIIACALVDKTLSYCWSTEESHLEEGWEASVAVARLLCEMK